MGDTHLRSNLKGQVGTETISNFTSISGATVYPTTGIKMGADAWIITGVATLAAGMEAAATALTTTATPDPCCMYLSTDALLGGVFHRGVNAASWTRQQ